MALILSDRPAKEIAAAIGSTPASVYQMRQNLRKTGRIGTRNPARGARPRYRPPPQPAKPLPNRFARPAWFAEPDPRVMARPRAGVAKGAIANSGHRGMGN